MSIPSDLTSIAASTACVLDSIMITEAKTEHSKAPVPYCKKLTFRVVDSTMLKTGSDLRYAWATGKVATPALPFMILDGGAIYSKEQLWLRGKTLYVASATAGDIVLLEMWK